MGTAPHPRQECRHPVFVFQGSPDEGRAKGELCHVFRPLRGLWQLSGYVLSKKAAQKLLNLLPVRGPVDLWINLQFDKLDVYASSKPVIRQRRDVSSTNSYSVLPALAGLGLLDRERPKKHKAGRLPRPLFAAGEPATGLTSLAMAVSMLGYRCCSDVQQLPTVEHQVLLRGRKDRVFDAYVNVPSLREHWLGLADVYPEAKFILTVAHEPALLQAEGTLGLTDPSPQTCPPRSGPMPAGLLSQLRSLRGRLLVLPFRGDKRWERLCRFLDCPVPNGVYPELPDIEPRSTHVSALPTSAARRTRHLPKWDKLPWILTPLRQRQSTALTEEVGRSVAGIWAPELREQFDRLDTGLWELLQDTFPGNRALFREDSFSIQVPGRAILSHAEGRVQSARVHFRLAS